MGQYFDYGKMEQYYDITTAAGKMNITKAKLYTMLKIGVIACIQPNGKNSKLFILEETINKYMENNKYIQEKEQDENYQNMLKRMGVKL